VSGDQEGFARISAREGVPAEGDVVAPSRHLSVRIKPEESRPPIETPRRTLVRRPLSTSCACSTPDGMKGGRGSADVPFDCSNSSLSGGLCASRASVVHHSKIKNPSSDNPEYQTPPAMTRGTARGRHYTRLALQISSDYNEPGAPHLESSESKILIPNRISERIFLCRIAGRSGVGSRYLFQSLRGSCR